MHQLPVPACQVPARSVMVVKKGLGDRGFMVFRGLWIEKRFTDSRCDAFETAHSDKFHECVYPHFIGYDLPDTRIPLAGKQQVGGVIMIAEGSSPKGIDSSYQINDRTQRRRRSRRSRPRPPITAAEGSGMAITTCRLPVWK